MISLDSVIALTNGFVTLENLKDFQYIQGQDAKTWLKHVEYGLMKSMLLSTKHFDLICSFSQKVVTHTGVSNAGDISEGDVVDTTTGEEVVVKCIPLNQFIEMGGLYIKSGRFLANGFILEGENG